MLGPNQKKWLEALRSGDYRQGTAKLNRDGKYCCLGVAAEVFKTDETHIETVGFGMVTAYDGEASCAPLYVQEALALRTRLGEADDYAFISLVGLNDSGRTFEEIADRLEAYPDVFFQEAR